MLKEPNVKLPTIKQLQCFLAVARELNFHRAAERLRMTQPPLTRQIQKLEETVGSPLFSRDTHQVHLTAAGRRLEAHAQRMIGQLTEVILGLRGENGRVKIAMTRTVNFNHIPAFNNALDQLADADDISSPHLTSRRLLDMLNRSELDLALVGEMSGNDAQNIWFQRIYREPMMLALPVSHPAAVGKNIGLQAVADLPLYWFTRSANPAYYDKCDAYFQTLPFNLQRQPEPADSLIMLASIARGKGMALMPRSMCVSSIDGLCYRALDNDADGALSIDIYLAVRQQEHSDKILGMRTRFINKIRDNHVVID